MGTQSPEPRQSEQSSKGLQYFIGLGLGLIPLLMSSSLLLFSSNPVGSFVGVAGLVLYVVLIIAAIVCLIIERVRFVGYGLLTMVLVDPVVFFIACTVQLAHGA